MIRKYVEELRARFAREAEAFHHHVIPERSARFAPLPRGLHPAVARALASQSIDRFYTHQAEAVTSVLAGRNTVVATATASGKTLAYNVPVLEACLADPAARALYIFPIKALEQDQRKTFEALAAALAVDAPPRAAIYDGDTPDHRRRKIRTDPPHVVITNPDMIHRSFLPYHATWKSFFANMKYVVLDELHNYKGVFGSHVAQVLRRLYRVARFYGADPVTVACSATIRNPREHAGRLTGRGFHVVAEDGSPRAERHFVLLSPRASTYTAAASLFTAAVRQGLKTIAFTKARKITELMFGWVARALPEMGEKISSYRAGFLPEERREIEQALFSGRMVGVISTSALELGIDIGGLDVCLLVGYPGTIVNTWQRGGRVGRSGRESVIVMVALQDALDQYFMRHPDDFFGRDFESVAIDPHNPQILGPHLECGAAELPLRTAGDGFDLESGREAVARMERERRLLRSADGSLLFAARKRPQRFVDIRSIGRGYTIFREGTRQVIGSVSGLRTFSECHEGAVYLHRGRQYVISHVDLDRGDIFARPFDADYYTKALFDKETEILEVLRRRPLGNFILNVGRLKVTETVTGFQKRNVRTQDLISAHPLDLPPQVFETVGLWFEYPAGLEGEMRGRGLHVMGGLHAVEHAVIAVFPLFTLCDRFDLGGISTTHHAQVEAPAVFVYDGHPGGVGLAEGAYDKAEALLEATLHLISDCPCEEGCPSCVHSPKCGSGNKPLDKAAAVAVLEIMLGRRSLSPGGEEAPPRARAEAPAEPPPPPLPDDPWAGRRVVVFDLETQRSAADVGGWNRANLMRVSVGVAWDSASNRFTAYREDELEDLLALLEAADLVVGFNSVRFDYAVLSGYAPRPRLDALATFDILAYIFETYEFRLGLDKLGTHTLDRGKTADGLQALAWWKEGRLEALTEYCRQDVELTRDLFLFGLREGYLLYERKGVKVRLPVEWDVADLARKARAR